jgi:hypothetical protein
MDHRTTEPPKELKDRKNQCFEWSSVLQWFENGVVHVGVLSVGSEDEIFFFPDDPVKLGEIISAWLNSNPGKGHR